MAMVTVPGAPWSKSRPRFTKTSRTYAQPDRDAEERTASYLKRVVKEPYPGNVGMACCSSGRTANGSTPTTF